MTQRHSVAQAMGEPRNQNSDMHDYFLRKNEDPIVERMGNEFSRIESVLSDMESQADCKYTRFLKRQRDKQEPKKKAKEESKQETLGVAELLKLSIQ